MEVKHAWEEQECLTNGSLWLDKDLKYSLDNLIHELMFKEGLGWSSRCVGLGYVCMLLFANDAMLLSENKINYRVRLYVAIRMTNLNINISNAKIIVFDTEKEVKTYKSYITATVKANSICVVCSYIYDRWQIYGKMFRGADSDKKGSGKYVVFCGELLWQRNKSSLYKIILLPTLLYRSVSWVWAGKI